MSTQPTSQDREPENTAGQDRLVTSAQCSELHWRYDPTYGSIDRDIQEHLAERGGDRTQQHIDGLNLQRRRNAGEPVLGWLQDHRVGLVKDLLTPDGQSRSGDDALTGLGEALAGLDRELHMVVSAALYERAAERLWMAEHAEQVSQHLPPEEFRDHALVAAEQAARLWREVGHVRRNQERVVSS